MQKSDNAHHLRRPSHSKYSFDIRELGRLLGELAVDAGDDAIEKHLEAGAGAEGLQRIQQPVGERAVSPLTVEGELIGSF